MFCILDTEFRILTPQYASIYSNVGYRFWFRPRLCLKKSNNISCDRFWLFSLVRPQQSFACLTWRSRIYVIHTPNDIVARVWRYQRKWLKISFAIPLEPFPLTFIHFPKFNCARWSWFGNRNVRHWQKYKRTKQCQVEWIHTQRRKKGRASRRCYKCRILASTKQPSRK